MNYRYYVVNKNQNTGAGMGSMGNLSATPLETIMMEQVLEVLRPGCMAHRYGQRIPTAHAELSEPEMVVTLFKRTAAVCNQLFPDVRKDIARSLVNRVTLSEQARHHPGLALRELGCVHWRTQPGNNRT